MSVAHFGDTFTSEQVSLDLGDEVYVGLFVCSPNKDVIEKAVFDNVRITVPVRDNFIPYREYIGSNLEVMDVADGNRRVIYTAPDSFQAPNWTRDGKALIYNRNGRLRRITAKGPSYLHGWSPDGKSLIYTGGRDSEYDIYKISASGGKETNLTNTKGLDDGPEYTPDGRYIYFNSTRSGTMQIWRMKPDFQYLKRRA